MSNEPARAMDELFDGDEVREVLREAFYKPAPAPVVKFQVTRSLELRPAARSGLSGREGWCR